MSSDLKDAAAIVGMGCWLPGARDLTRLWTTLQRRRVAVGAVPPDRWNHDSFYDKDPRRPDRTYSRVLGTVEDVDRFCPEFYGLLPRRARVMDPQQRLLLEVARTAIEDSGYAPRELPRATGVYVGISVSEHYTLTAARLNAMQMRDGRFGRVAPGLTKAFDALVEKVPETHAYSMIGQMLNIAATNVSQAFRLTGPAFAVDSACSSALVALGEAILHLRTGSCDAALVGGVYVACTPSNLIGFARIGALSRSDACRPFDERADGFVVGEGAGCVLLKRLEDALRAGDRIWAVIRGFGMNNDGPAAGPMTPKLEGQVACMEQAYADARMSPAQVGLVEAHGTGTRVGDFVEANSLLEVFGPARRGVPAPTCWITAVKGNIGHTLAAAGVAGLLSAVMSLAHRRIPPLAGFERPRRDLPLGDAGIAVSATSREWGRKGERRAAALSSFGFGGTNVHVVLEEAPEVAAPLWHSPPRASEEEPELFVLSAPNLALLAGFARELASWIPESGALLRDIAWTLARRRPDCFRAALVASSRAELLEGLGKVAVAAEGGEADVFLYGGEEVPRTEEIVRSTALSHVRGVRLTALPMSRLESQPYSVLAALPEPIFHAPSESSVGSENIDARSVSAASGGGAPKAPCPGAERSVVVGGFDRGAIERRLVEIVAKVSALPPQDISPRMRLSGDLGFDSLMIVELGAAIQEAFGFRELPPGLLGRDPTLADLGETFALSRAGNEASKEGFARHTVRWVQRRIGPLGAPAFAGRAIVLGEGRTASALAARLRRGGRETQVVASDRPFVWPPDTGLLVDVASLGGRALPGAAELKAPVMRASAALAAAARAGVRPAYLGIASGLPAAGPFGFAKALALEWPDRLTRALEISPSADAAQIGEWAWAELCTSDRSPEVRWTTGERCVVELRPEPLPKGELSTGTAIITGGGRGLGGRLAVALARAGVRNVALLGRRPADAEVERVLSEVAAAGGKALYLPCDVCDQAALSGAVARARFALGPIHLAVHAAGVTADGPVTEIAASAASVFDTKVAGALGLWRACREEPLTAFLVYGSWAGRFGNRHQTVYAAANRVVSALVSRLALERTDVHVASVDLPPWEGSGMVERMPEAARQALRLRVPFVRDEEGLPFLLAELAGPPGAAEVVLGSGPAGFGRRDRARIVLDPKAPWLDDHRIDGVSYVPLAAALDLLAAAAGRVGLFPSPGRALVLRNMSLFAPITVGEKGVTLSVEARAGSLGAEIELWLEPCDPLLDEPRLVGQCQAEVGEGVAPLALPPGGVSPRLALDRFYSHHTFHGPRLRGITSVQEIGAGHVLGVVRTAEADWPRNGLDILALDGVFQLAGFFARERLEQSAVPHRVRECLLLRPLEADAEMTCLGVLEQAESEELRGHIDLRDRDGVLRVQLRGLEARRLGGEVSSPASVAPSTYRIEEFPEVLELGRRLELAEALGLDNPYFRVHERLTNHRSRIGGAEYLNFSSYNYLGLSGHPKVNEAVAEAVARYGTSVSASRLASGEKPLHRELEGAIASYLDRDDAIVMVSGHATNVSVIGCLFDHRDVILHDSLAHDSILAGIKLSGAKRRPFPHNDPESLERLLAQVRGESRRALIAIEGVYSMDGDLAPLDQIIELKHRYGALLFVDEAHSLGVVGRTGRGIGEHYGVSRGDVDLWMGTLSKSLASCGGYVAGSRALIHYLKYSNPGFVYSVGISPSNAAAALAALGILEREPERVATLQARAHWFLEALRERGIDTGFSRGSAVVPCIVPNSVDCLRLAQALFNRGINVQPILHPAVEEKLCRLRFFITSTHSESDLQTTAEALREELLAINPSFLTPRGQESAIR